MRKERIKIGDDWYVKEIKDEVVIKEDFIYTRTITYECDKFCIEGSVLEEDGKFSMPWINHVNKKDSDGSWVADNESYLIGLSDRNAKWMTIIDNENPELASAILQIIDEMNRLGWFNKE